MSFLNQPYTNAGPPAQAGIARPAPSDQQRAVIEISDDDDDSDVIILTPRARTKAFGSFRNNVEKRLSHGVNIIEYPSVQPSFLPASTQNDHHGSFPEPASTVAFTRGAAVGHTLATGSVEAVGDSSSLGRPASLGQGKDPLLSAAAQALAEPEQRLSAQDCLNKVLDIFPDIAHDHVLGLFHAGADGETRSEAWCNEVIHQVVESGSYPKERDRRQELKRKRTMHGDDADCERYEAANRENPGSGYAQQAQKILQDEFPEVPVKHITDTLRAKRFLFATYFALEADERTYGTKPNAPYKKVKARMKKPRRSGGPSFGRADEEPFGLDELTKELEAARKKKSKDDNQRRNEAERALLEERNERAARASNAVTDCGCCFSDFPNNRMTYCDGDEPHFFCFDCARQLVQTLVGESRCRPLCMDTGGCKAPFARDQLCRFVDAKTLEKLERMQQDEDIRLAALDDLVECPFCDYKAVCPPIEVDKEFRCHNPECEKVSCRLCSRETHIPMSCHENEKENKVNIRHTMEEAMTEALLRSCNKCKNKFIKESGCNKMTCPRCHNTQCYVCSKDVKGYTHFNHGRCSLSDDTDARHEQEVKKAEQETRAQLRAENPGLSDGDLEIKVSKTVAQDEQRRARPRREADWINHAYGRPLGHPVPPHLARFVNGVPQAPPLPQPMPYGAPPPQFLPFGQFGHVGFGAHPQRPFEAMARPPPNGPMHAPLHQPMMPGLPQGIHPLRDFDEARFADFARMENQHPRQGYW